MSSASSIPLEIQSDLYFLIKLLGCDSKIPPGLIQFILIFLSLDNT